MAFVINNGLRAILGIVALTGIASATTIMFRACSDGGSPREMIVAQNDDSAPLVITLDPKCYMDGETLKGARSCFVDKTSGRPTIQAFTCDQKTCAGKIAMLIGHIGTESYDGALPQGQPWNECTACYSAYGNDVKRRSECIKKIDMSGRWTKKYTKSELFTYDCKSCSTEDAVSNRLVFTNKSIYESTFDSACANNDTSKRRTFIRIGNPCDSTPTRVDSDCSWNRSCSGGTLGAWTSGSSQGTCRSYDLAAGLTPFNPDNASTYQDLENELVRRRSAAQLIVDVTWGALCDYLPAILATYPDEYENAVNYCATYVDPSDPNQTFAKLCYAYYYHHQLWLADNIRPTGLDLLWAIDLRQDGDKTNANLKLPPAGVSCIVARDQFNFSTPLIQLAFGWEARFIAKAFKPKYLSLGAEIGQLYANPVQKEGFIGAFSWAKDRIRQDGLTPVIFTYFQYEDTAFDAGGLWNGDINASWANTQDAFRRLPVDAYGFSSYPQMLQKSGRFPDSSTFPLNYFNPIITKLGTAKPMIFAELGATVLDGNTYHPGISPQTDQARFMDNFFKAVATMTNLQVVNWYFYHDLDHTRFGDYDPATVKFFSGMGLLPDENGPAKLIDDRLVLERFFSYSK